MSLVVTKLHDHIYYYPNAIEDIKKFMDLVDDVNSISVTPWMTWYADGTPSGYPYGHLKQLNRGLLKEELDIVVRNKAEEIISTITTAMADCTIDYLVNHGCNQDEIDSVNKSLLTESHNFGIRKYNEKESMGPHPDKDFSTEVDHLTISVYLDNDYEGGELGFPNPEIDLKIKANAGSIVVFPSTYLHESHYSPSGRKTILTHVHTTKTKIL